MWALVVVVAIVKMTVVALAIGGVPVDIVKILELFYNRVFVHVAVTLMPFFRMTLSWSMWVFVFLNPLWYLLIGVHLVLFYMFLMMKFEMGHWQLSAMCPQWVQ